MINLNLNFNFQEANKKTGPNFKISKSVSRKKGAETIYTHLRLFIFDYRLLGILKDWEKLSDKYLVDIKNT